MDAYESTLLAQLVEVAAKQNDGKGRTLTIRRYGGDNDGIWYVGFLNYRLPTGARFAIYVNLGSALASALRDLGEDVPERPTEGTR